MFILNSVTQSGLCTNLLFPRYTSCVFFPLMCSCLWRSPKYVFLLPPNHVPETENMLVLLWWWLTVLFIHFNMDAVHTKTSFQVIF